MYLKPLHRSKTIVLVVEDDPFRRAGLCRLVTAAGYGLAATPGDADLVLAGIGTGAAPSPALQRRDGAVPLILLVDRGVWSGLDFLDAADALGADAVLPRPFSRSALLALMAKVLAPSPCDEDGSAAPPNLADLIHLDSSNFA